MIPEVEEVWQKSTISDVNYLVALLGPTGGRKGYGAITGEPPGEKSVCWWVNNKLLPEIYVERGKTYSFRVQGGDGHQHQLLNHPLYITSDREGGYGNKNQYERERETIYAGVKNEYGIVGVGSPPGPGQATNSIFFCFRFGKKFIVLQGGQMNPLWGNTFLFHSSQQLPRVYRPMKSFLS